MKSVPLERRGWIARSLDFDQSVIIAPKVQEHLAGHRQHHFWSREAGGQLFGRFDANTMQVLEASGPYRKDTRSRYSYRSNPESAQRSINAYKGRDLHYVGEWHTHPQHYPEPSSEDLDTVGQVVRRSELRVSALLLLIQGLAAGPTGLAVYSCDGTNLTRWGLSEATDVIGVDGMAGNRPAKTFPAS